MLTINLRDEAGNLVRTLTWHLGLDRAPILVWEGVHYQYESESVTEGWVTLNYVPARIEVVV